jgi:hypothetical protein
MPDLLLDIRLRWRKVRTLIMLIMDAGAYRARSAGGALRKGGAAGVSSACLPLAHMRRRALRRGHRLLVAE